MTFRLFNTPFIKHSTIWLDLVFEEIKTEWIGSWIETDCVLTCILQILESSSRDSLLPSSSMIPFILSQYWAWSMLPAAERHRHSDRLIWSAPDPSLYDSSSYPPVLLTGLSSPPTSPKVYLCQWHFSPSLTPCSLQLTLSPGRRGIYQRVVMIYGENFVSLWCNQK